MSRKGFTLIELMITIAVVGILSTVAIAKFGTYLDRKDLETESYKLYSFVNKYKVDSYKTEKAYYFQVAGVSPDYTIFNVYEDDGTGNPSGTPCASYNIASNAEITMEKSPKVTGVYMNAGTKITGSKFLKIEPLSLGFVIDGGAIGDSVVVTMKHKKLDDNYDNYTMTFYYEQARVRLARNGKDI